MPETDATRDLHRKDDFADTSVEAVSSFVGKEDFIRYHAGFIPDTFRGLESMRIAFAHVDVDIHRSILDSCAFIYPRLLQGGIMVFDDYGVASRWVRAPRSTSSSPTSPRCPWSSAPARPSSFAPWLRNPSPRGSAR